MTRLPRLTWLSLLPFSHAMETCHPSLLLRRVKLDVLRTPFPSSLCRRKLCLPIRLTLARLFMFYCGFKGFQAAHLKHSTTAVNPLLKLQANSEQDDMAHRKRMLRLPGPCFEVGLETVAREHLQTASNQRLSCGSGQGCSGSRLFQLSFGDSSPCRDQESTLRSPKTKDYFQCWLLVVTWDARRVRQLEYVRL